MSQKKPPIIIILGPTASGKTELSIKLAKHVGGEIISADSRQIYRTLDIGTEKVTEKEMGGIPHHCIDIASPRRSLSVERWRQHARQAIVKCYKHGTMPLVVGGTGLYIDALVYGTNFPSVQPDMALRRMLEKKPTTELCAILEKLDPVRAQNIEKQNPRRLIRAIEIVRTLGSVPILANKKPLYEVTWIGINPPFPVLEERIAKRLSKALEKGLVDETRKLREELGISWRRINELGMEYRVCGEYLRGDLSKDKLHEKLTREVRRYAKRQLTWLKRYQDVSWHESAEEALRTWMSRYP
ncbi:MAG: tRNA (adenosine(37)-N6)-dimethylallyltransferase MiaA [Candidatus Pacebacteria bacterium]|nr:tRNA (adenosine(37)-N6)-dimethylallyltransferase MiaA [Candidatus Paceibacterota bacterium]